ncbi:MAG TPA: TIGR02587 family membrane protein [Trichocoleus sp.]|jgi:putative integral membrane protein (TIGR02587 family)
MRRRTLPRSAEWQQELEDIIRGISGGFLFGIPLMYTMEVWWIGSYATPLAMLLVLLSTFFVVFLLNRTDGFRQVYPDRPMQALMDSVEALAIGAVCVTGMLILLQEIRWGIPLNEALGKIVFEGVPFSIGVALARSLLNGERNQAQDENSSQPQQQGRYSATLADVGATLVGSIIIAFSIAPTDEVPMLAAATSPPWLLAMLIISLVLSYLIVFAAGFTTQQRRLQQQGLFQRPITETVLSYLLSLGAAVLMLWFFQRLDFQDPWISWLEQSMLLGLPATIGGAAGRLTV